jgi:hypothetical protein
MVNEVEYQRLVNEIRLFMKQAEQNFLLVKPAVDWIVEHQITSQTSIEKTLDTILGFVPIGIGIEEYHKLNDFYSTLYPKEAKEYKKLYKKICDEDY